MSQMQPNGQVPNKASVVVAQLITSPKISINGPSVLSIACAGLLAFALGQVALNANSARNALRYAKRYEYW